MNLSITLQEAKQLKLGTILYHLEHKNADGTPQRWRVTGKPKVWKRSPEKVKVPLKNGLYHYGYLDETILSDLSLKDPCLNWSEADEVSEEDLEAAASMFDQITVMKQCANEE
jgi:hypothetical protein